MCILRGFLIVLAAIIIGPIALALAVCLLLVLFYLLIYILCGVTELIYGLVIAPLRFLRSDQKDCGKRQETHDQKV